MTRGDLSDPVGISVVIPSFNHGRFIAAAVDSLLNQNYPNLEVIVMDGGSQDGTVESLRGYGNRIAWISEPDNGQTDAIIKGFARASKSWIAWLNSDDIQCDRALWRVNDAVQSHPDTQVIVGRGHYMAEDGSFLRPYPTIPMAAGTDLKREFFQRGYLAQPSAFFTRALYEQVGGLNPSLKFCMDYELWCRFALAGARFREIDADISGNRWYETTKTSAQLLDLLSEVAATQRRLFGAVSPYYVQGISDYLYSVLYARHFGSQHHLALRWLYFKCLWLLLNATRPAYCIGGLFGQSIAKTGPIEADFLTWTELWKAWRTCLAGAVRRAR
jgi:glycosyltransferase involved in cell wall biosynthesis